MNYIELFFCTVTGQHGEQNEGNLCWGMSMRDPQKHTVHCTGEDLSTVGVLKRERKKGETNGAFTKYFYIMRQLKAQL